MCGVDRVAVKHCFQLLSLFTFISIENAKIRPLITPKSLNRSSPKLTGVITTWMVPGVKIFCSDRFKGFCSPNTRFYPEPLGRLVFGFFFGTSFNNKPTPFNGFESLYQHERNRVLKRTSNEELNGYAVICSFAEWCASILLCLWHFANDNDNCNIYNVLRDMPFTTGKRGTTCIMFLVACVFGFVVYYHVNIVSRGHQVLLRYSITSTGAVDKQQQQKTYTNNVIVVHTVGNFSKRLLEFNDFLSSFRINLTERHGKRQWQRPKSGRLNVVLGRDVVYLQQLQHHSSVTTVAFPWLTDGLSRKSMNYSSNLLLSTYYGWTADDKMCSWLETPGHKFYKKKCNRDINDTSKPAPLELSLYSSKPVMRNQYWPQGMFSYPAEFDFLIHIHLDAIVTRYGDVISGNLKLVLPSCRRDMTAFFPPSYASKSVPLYDELFVIVPHGGGSYYHRLIEIVPRIALFATFLKINTHIKILTPRKGRLLAYLIQMIGIHKSRLVAGIARAKFVYQPRSIPCGIANAPETQALSQIYREYIKFRLRPQQRNRLLLIRRSKSRRFLKQKIIEKTLERTAKDYNLTYTLYIDNPLPSLIDQMLLFNSAVMIVAAVGAGESNMLFSQPGTYIIEGVCDPPHVNLCFQRLAHILGHHWHGIMSPNGCMRYVNLSPAALDYAVRKHLDLWKLTHHF